MTFYIKHVEERNLLFILKFIVYFKIMSAFVTLATLAVLKTTSNQKAHVPTRTGNIIACFWKYRIQIEKCYTGGFVCFVSLLPTKADHPLQMDTSDEYLSSEKWLQKYGLKPQKLTLYDALADCTFRHVDGIVDIKTKPEDESSQTDAVSTVYFPSCPLSWLIFLLNLKTWLIDVFLIKCMVCCYVFFVKNRSLVEWEKVGHK